MLGHLISISYFKICFKKILKIILVQSVFNAYQLQRRINFLFLFSSPLFFVVVSLKKNCFPFFLFFFSFLKNLSNFYTSLSSLPRIVQAGISYLLSGWKKNTQPDFALHQLKKILKDRLKRIILMPCTIKYWIFKNLCNCSPKITMYSHPPWYYSMGQNWKNCTI